jgi:hypothetical protein
MIELIMYFGIGFLFAALIGVAAAPLIHDRAARLTMRRLENSIPQSMAEIQADKDLLRAEFAMSARLLEIEVEKLKEQNTSQLAELGRKKNAVNRFKIEREAQMVETVALKSEVESLKARLASVGKKMKAPEVQRCEPDVASLVPSDWQRANPERTPANSAVRNEQRDDSEVLTLVTEETAANEPRLAPDAGHGSLDKRDVGMAEDASGSIAPAQSSIYVSPDDQVAYASFAAERTPRSLRSLSVVTLLGVGAAMAWHSYGDEAKEILGSWTSPLSHLFVPTKKMASAPVTPVAASADVAPQDDAPSQGLADTKNSVKQSTATQEQTSQDVPSPQALEPDDNQKLASTEPQERSKLAPFPETKPTTIAGWALLEVANGAAVIKGPNGVWRVVRGDTVPGVGRIDSIVRWGNRWIVATSSGLISTP